MKQCAREKQLYSGSGYAKSHGKQKNKIHRIKEKGKIPGTSQNLATKNKEASSFSSDPT